MMSVDEHLRVAVQLHHAGQLAQAEAVLYRILETHPTHAKALHLLGILAYQVGKIPLGIQFIERAIQASPHTALFYSNIGEMQRKLHAIPISIEYGQQAVALDPHSATAWSNLGIAYYDAKNYSEAEKCHQRALAINPSLHSSLNNMGSIYTAYDQPKTAITYYQAAIRIAPQSVDPLNNLGALLLQEQAFQTAFQYLEQALRLAPNFVDAHCNMGLVLLGLEQADRALIHFEKALQLKPTSAEAYYGMAKTHLYQHQFIEAESAIRKALSMSPQQFEFYQILADISLEQGDYQQALIYLNEILDKDATHSPTFLKMGSVLMEMGETNQAETQFLKAAVDSNKDTQVLAYYSLAQLKKATPDSASLKPLLSFVNQPIQTVSSSKLEYAYFALGKIYDDLGEWSKSFEYFSLGCHLKRTRQPYDIAEQIRFAHRLTQSITRETIDYLQAFANPSAVPIFIVGMPRSGTTLIEQIISTHSQVYGAGELKYLHHLIQQPVQHHQRTLHYPENLLHCSPEIGHSITQHYLAYLQRFSPNALHITDKMPSNFIAIGVIYALFPNAKIIHVERDPIDTCWSCFTKLFTQGQLYSYDLTELGQYYQSYAKIMTHWRRVLPSAAWLDIKYETLMTNFDYETKRLLDFCDLRWEPDCLSFYQSKRPVRTASFAQVRQPPHTASIGRWRHYEQELAPLIRILNQSLDSVAQQQV